MSDDDKISAIATPEDLALAAEVTKIQTRLRDEVIPMLDRARYAEIAGEVWDFGAYAGIELPQPYKRLIGAIAFFGPVLKNVPGYALFPAWAREAFEHMLEGADLAYRTFAK